MLERAGLEAAARAIRGDVWETEPNPTIEQYCADLRRQAKDQAEAAISAYLEAVGGAPAQAPAVQVKGTPEYERLCTAASQLSLAETISVNKTDLRVVLGYINETGPATTTDERAVEALIEKYAPAVWTHDMSSFPHDVIRQHFREFANDVAALAQGESRNG